MKLVRPVWQDLRSKRLWPVALGLLVAIVAVPALLSSSSSPVAVTPPALPASPAPGPGLPAVNEKTGPAGAVLSGRGRDPFGAAAGATANGAASGAGPSSATPATPGAVSPATPAAGGSPGSSSGSGSSGSSGSGFTGGGSGSSSGPPAGHPKPDPGPLPGLAPRQSYAVKLAVTNPRGGLDTIDPLRRLSPLPSRGQALLVELGVLRGGYRVLFAVQPGTVVSGPGSCIPGPIDCEVLSLGRGQTERVGHRSGGHTVTAAMFAVTGISAAGHPDLAAANRARRDASPAGRRLISHSPLAALSLFSYDLKLGAVVDLRNLQVGSG